MTATLIQTPDRVILRNIRWQTYQSLIRDFEAEPAIRLTYDGGTLEIRMPLDPHETYKKLIGRLIEAATEELDLEIRSLGSRTCDREDLAKGLEPDQCYYIQNEPLVRAAEQIDLALLPPPDLAVEIDISKWVYLINYKIDSLKPLSGLKPIVSLIRQPYLVVL
jgi:Uma2 family endonuclease